jgi:hypothetical protein
VRARFGARVEILNTVRAKFTTCHAKVTFSYYNYINNNNKNHQWRVMQNDVKDFLFGLVHRESAYIVIGTMKYYTQHFLTLHDSTQAIQDLYQRELMQFALNDAVVKHIDKYYIQV